MLFVYAILLNLFRNWLAFVGLAASTRIPETPAPVAPLLELLQRLFYLLLFHSPFFCLL